MFYNERNEVESRTVTLLCPRGSVAITGRQNSGFFSNADTDAFLLILILGGGISVVPL